MLPNQFLSTHKRAFRQSCRFFLLFNEVLIHGLAALRKWSCLACNTLSSWFHKKRVEWNILHIEPTSSVVKWRQNVVKSILFTSSEMALKSPFCHKNARCGAVLTLCGFALHRISTSWSPIPGLTVVCWTSESLFVKNRSKMFLPCVGSSTIN